MAGIPLEVKRGLCGAASALSISANHCSAKRTGKKRLAPAFENIQI